MTGDAVAVEDRLNEGRIIDDARVEREIAAVLLPVAVRGVDKIGHDGRVGRSQRGDGASARVLRGRGNRIAVFVAADTADRFAGHKLDGARHALNLAPLRVKRLEVDFAERGHVKIRASVFLDGHVAPAAFRVIGRDAHRRRLVERAVVELFRLADLLHNANRLNFAPFYVRLQTLIDVGERDLSDGVAVEQIHAFGNTPRVDGNVLAVDGAYVLPRILINGGGEFGVLRDRFDAVGLAKSAK